MKQYFAVFTAYLLFGASGLTAEICPPGVDWYVREGLTHLQNNSPDNAELYFKTALALDSEGIDAYLALGKLYLSKGLDKKSLKTYDGMRRDFSIALGFYGRALRRDSVNATALNNIGLIYYEMNQFNEAKTFYEKALRYQPDHRAALENMGHVMFWINVDSDYYPAINYWRKALAANTSDTDNAALVWKNIGIAFYKMGMLDSAITAYLESIKLNPEAADTYVWYGRALATQQQPQKAIEQFRNAIARDPFCVEAYGAWAEILYTAKDDHSQRFKDRTKELRDLINRVKDSAPDDRAKYYLYLGHIYLAEDKVNRAMAYYDRAREIDSTIIVPLMK